MEKPRIVVTCTAVALLTTLLLAIGCHNGLRRKEALSADGAPEPVAVARLEQVIEPGGALLWSQNCARCHNLRNPHERSDREWSAIVHQMRVRANLTSEEHRLILRFLKMAN